MRKYILLVWASFLTACLPPDVDRNCGPYGEDGRAWAFAQKADTREAYRKYLDEFPDGCFVAEAAAKLKAAVPPKKIKKVPGGGPGGGGTGTY